MSSTAMHRVDYASIGGAIATIAAWAAQVSPIIVVLSGLVTISYTLWRWYRAWKSHR
jgi:hypothetical protein